MSVYQVLLSLIPFTLLPSNSNHQCLWCIIDKRAGSKRIGISKLEGPVTYSTRSEFKVIGSSESQLKFDSDIT
jgi:hypothetical protein